MNNEFSYKKGMQELEQIVSDIEKGLVDIDELSVKVKRANELIMLLQGKLRGAENEISKLLPQQ